MGSRKYMWDCQERSGERYCKLHSISLYSHERESKTIWNRHSCILVLSVKLHLLTLVIVGKGPGPRPHAHTRYYYSISIFVHVHVHTPCSYMYMFGGELEGRYNILYYSVARLKECTLPNFPAPTTHDYPVQTSLSTQWDAPEWQTVY